jgi:EAL domain-containing protein (putative c-di-GMP-specific phosphodiesterase class I)
MSCLPDMIKIDSVLFQVLQSDEREVLFHILAKLDRFHTSVYSEMRALEIEDILKKVI